MPSKTSHLQRFGAYWALFAGVLLPLAFSPFELYALAIISPALLLAVLLKSNLKQAFFRGWLYGVGYFGVGISWVYISMHTYGLAPAWMAVVGTIIFVMFLALFFGLMSYLFNKLLPHNTIAKCSLAFPALWVLFEWMRTVLMTGFPWILLGYSQVEAPLRGFAPIFSVYGVSFATAMTAGLLISVIFMAKKPSKAILLILIIAFLWSGSVALAHINWTKPIGKPVTVSMIQGNVSQSVKWKPEQVQKSINRYVKLTHQHWSSDIIIWPEAAIAIPKSLAQNFLDQLATAAKKHNTTLITGIPIIENHKYYNAMIAIGDGHGQYLKRHLVPFGEYMPFRYLLDWLRNYVLIPMSDLSSGPKNQADIIAGKIKIAPFICYEIIYPAEVLAAASSSEMIVVISDDSWFGRSIAPAQQLQMTQMRAQETGREILASTNNGITAIIGTHGKIKKFVDPFTITVLTSEAQPVQGKTPLMIIGIWPVIVFSLLVLLWTGWRNRRGK